MVKKAPPVEIQRAIEAILFVFPPCVVIGKRSGSQEATYLLEGTLESQVEIKAEVTKKSVELCAIWRPPSAIAWVRNRIEPLNAPDLLARYGIDRVRFESSKRAVCIYTSYSVSPEKHVMEYGLELARFSQAIRRLVNRLKVSE